MKSSHNNIPRPVVDEDQFSAFEQDARDGYRQFPHAATKTRAKNHRLFWLIPSLAVLVLAMVWIQYSRPKTSQTPRVTATKMDRNDWILPDSIRELREIPKSEQIKLPRRSAANQPRVPHEQPSTDEPGMIGTLPIRQAKTSDQVHLHELDRHSYKEIYLNGIKLVDYRGIRNDNTLETATTFMTGTPAAFEQTETDEQKDWQTERVSYHFFIGETAQQVKAGNFKQALNRCNHILKTYPTDINAQFYRGFCLYNLGEFHAAATALQHVRSHEIRNFSEEATWYLALTYLQLNENVQARALLSEIVLENGFYASEAKKKLKNL